MTRNQLGERTRWPNLQAHDGDTFPLDLNAGQAKHTVSRLVFETHSASSLSPAHFRMHHQQGNYAVEIVEELVRATIPKMQASFDTHELIIALAQGNQRSYIEALQRVNGDAPFQTLHSMIGKTVLKLAPEFELSHEASRSPDIFGQKNSCVLWKKK